MFKNEHPMWKIILVFVSKENTIDPTCNIYANRQMHIYKFISISLCIYVFIQNHRNIYHQLGFSVSYVGYVGHISFASTLLKADFNSYFKHTMWYD